MVTMATTNTNTNTNTSSNTTNVAERRDDIMGVWVDNHVAADSVWVASI
jgi:hypothetical protein